MIASLVATLKYVEGSSLEDTVERLTQRQEIEIGPLHGLRLPITIEAADTSEMESLTKWVQELNGVLHVDIVFASCEQIGAGE